MTKHDLLLALIAAGGSKWTEQQPDSYGIALTQAVDAIWGQMEAAGWANSPPPARIQPPAAHTSADTTTYEPVKKPRGRQQKYGAEPDKCDAELVPSAVWEHEAKTWEARKSVGFCPRKAGGCGNSFQAGDQITSVDIGAQWLQMYHAECYAAMAG